MPRVALPVAITPASSSGSSSHAALPAAGRRGGACDQPAGLSLHDEFLRDARRTDDARTMRADRTASRRLRVDPDAEQEPAAAPAAMSACAWPSGRPLHRSASAPTGSSGDWRVLQSGVLAVLVLVGGKEQWLDTERRLRCAHGCTASQACRPPAVSLITRSRSLSFLRTLSLAPWQIHNSTAPRSTRCERCCVCTNAKGLHVSRGERLALPSAPPLYADVLARQTPAVLLQPGLVWGHEVPGTRGLVWLDEGGVARCRHGSSRPTLERRRVRGGGGCACSPAGLRMKRTHTARRRSRGAAVPLSALAASALLSRSTDGPA